MAESERQKRGIFHGWWIVAGCFILLAPLAQMGVLQNQVLLIIDAGKGEGQLRGNP